MNLNEIAPADLDNDGIADYARRQVIWLKKAPIATGRHTFLMGEALSRVKGTTQDGDWAGWLRRNRIPKETARQAVIVFEFFKTLDAVKGRTVMELKRAAGLFGQKGKSKPTPGPAFVKADAPTPILWLDSAVKAVIDAGEELAGREDFRQLVAELVKLADLNGGPAKTRQGGKRRAKV